MDQFSRAVVVASRGLIVMASSLCSKSVSGFLNSTTSTVLPNSGNLTLQKACHGLQLQTRVGVYETQRHSPGELG